MNQKLLFLCVLLSVSPIVLASGLYGGGEGTLAEPFLIATAAHLNEIAGIEEDWDNHFLQIADIDLEGIPAFTKAVIAPDTDISNLEFDGIAFSGVFDGNGYSIRNLIIAAEGSYVGLFGKVSSGGQVKDVGLESVHITGREHVGSLCGYNHNGTITDCYATGSVTSGDGSWYLGGLCGRNHNGTITTCYATVSVQGGASDIGGLCGVSWNGTITDCYATGSVTGGEESSYIGGLCGYSYSGRITNCYATGSVQGVSHLGGLCGWNNGNITNCFWDTETSDMLISDGGTGLSTSKMQDLATYTDVGWSFYEDNGYDADWYMPLNDYPRLLWQFSIGHSGQLSLSLPENDRIQLEMGVYSLSSSEINWTITGFGLCNWITEISPASGSSVGPDDITTVAISIDAFGLNVGDYDCDLTLAADNGDSIILPIKLTVYKQVVYAGGSGTAGDPYLIQTAEHLILLGNYSHDLDKHFRLIADIDMDPIVTGIPAFTTAVIAPNTDKSNSEFDGIAFTGVFDGAGHVISNLEINDGGAGNDYLGLFGRIEGSSAEIKNLGLEKLSVTGGDYLGGLCGSNSGTLTNCYATGSVTGYNGLGGLCGDNNYEGTLTNCYAICSVTGGTAIGGLCGYNSGTMISNCYATGLVNGDDYVGGLCGRNNSGAITNCFWDTDTSSMLTSDGGTGMSTIEMLDLATYTDAGWDFVGEAENGTADVWRMCVEKNNYPRLAWEFSRRGDFDCPCGPGIEDIIYLAGRWLGMTPETAGAADATRDGKVNLIDFALLSKHWMGEVTYVPDVVGMTRAEAEASISSASLIVGTITLVYDDIIPDGFVISTEPEGGSRVAIGSVVNLVVSKAFEVVSIPGGTFQMGNSKDASEGFSDELPVHTVTLSSFSMSRHEITNGQYCGFLNLVFGQDLIEVIDGVVYKSGSGTDNPYCDTSTSPSESQINYSGGIFSVRTKGGRDMSNDPMVKVSWYGAVAYCNWVSQQGGRDPCYNLSTWQCDFSKNGYHLPTEAQWEYAARGGLSGQRFPWGNTINHDYANYIADGSYYTYDTSPYTTWTYHPVWNDGIQPYTSPVGSFVPNGYGLYDMAGNVQELCNDWYSDTYYSSSPQINPIGPETGRYCVIRGGDWGFSAYYSRVAKRMPQILHYRNKSIGFRISLD